MSTLRTSVRAALLGACTLGTLSIGGCASAGGAAPGAVPGAVPRPTIRVENQSQQQVDVYLVQETREWRLGRLAPGAKGTLPLPAPALADGRTLVRLAIVPGATRTFQPERDARAIITVSQPLGAVLGQAWTFAQGQLTGLRPHPLLPPR